MAENIETHPWIYRPSSRSHKNLLVERLGEGGGGSDVGIAGSLVGTSGLLEGLSVSKVGGAVGLVGSGVVGLKVDIEELGEHLDVGLEALNEEQLSDLFEHQLVRACTERRARAHSPQCTQPAQQRSCLASRVVAQIAAGGCSVMRRDACDSSTTTAKNNSTQNCKVVLTIRPWVCLM